MILRFILYAVVFYFVWRFLDSMFSFGRRQTSPNANPNRRKPNQKVSVQFDKKSTKSKVAKDVGEYVDFEEIDDSKR